MTSPKSRQLHSCPPPAVSTVGTNSNTTRTPNSRFGLVTKKPNDWAWNWYDPVRNPRRIDAEKKTLMIFAESAVALGTTNRDT